MNRVPAPAHILIWFASIFLALQATASEVSNSKMTTQITIKRQAHVNAIKNENLKQALRHYASDVRLMPEANLTILGKSNAEAYFTQFFKRFDIKNYSSDTITTIEMQGYVLDIGNFNLEITNSTGNLRTLAGNYADLWQLDHKGKLSLIASIWTYTHWPDFKEELQFPLQGAVNTSFGQQVPLNNSASLELEAYNLLNTAAVLQRDASTLSNMYSDDGIIIPNYNETIIGRENIYNYWAKHAAELPMFEKLDNSSDKIIDLGEHVIQFASHLAIYRTDSYSGVSTGKHLRIWERGNDGRLKITFSISAYDN